MRSAVLGRMEQEMVELFIDSQISFPVSRKHLAAYRSLRNVTVLQEIIYDGKVCLALNSPRFILTVTSYVQLLCG